MLGLEPCGAVQLSMYAVALCGIVGGLVGFYFTIKTQRTLSQQPQGQSPPPISRTLSSDDVEIEALRQQ